MAARSAGAGASLNLVLRLRPAGGGSQPQEASVHVATKNDAFLRILREEKVDAFVGLAKAQGVCGRRRDEPAELRPDPLGRRGLELRDRALGARLCLLEAQQELGRSLALVAQ